MKKSAVSWLVVVLFIVVVVAAVLAQGPPGGQAQPAGQPPGCPRFADPAWSAVCRASEAGLSVANNRRAIASGFVCTWNGGIA